MAQGVDEKNKQEARKDEEEIKKEMAPLKRMRDYLWQSEKDYQELKKEARQGRAWNDSTIEDQYPKNSRAVILLNQMLSKLPEHTNDLPRDKWKSALDQICTLKILMRTKPDEIKSIGTTFKIKDMCDKESSVKEDSMYSAVTKSMSADELRQATQDPQKFMSNIGRLRKHYLKGAFLNAPEMELTQNINNRLSELQKNQNGTAPVNNKEYDKMYWSIERANTGYNRGRVTNQLQAMLNFEAVEATKGYIEKSKSIKSSEQTAEERERFNLAVRFLGLKMPPDDFKNYIDNLNRERGAEKPGPDHLDAEEFIYTTAEREIQSALMKINETGEDISQEEAAKIAAAYDLSAEKVPDAEEVRPNFQKMFTVAELNRKAEEIQREPKFIEQYKSMTPDERKKAFKTNPDKIGDYLNASPEKQPEDIEQKNWKIVFVWKRWKRKIKNCIFLRKVFKASGIKLRKI